MDDNKIIIGLLIIIVVILSICLGVMYLNNTNDSGTNYNGIEYEKYTIKDTGTTFDIPVNSKIVEDDELINITNDEGVWVLVFKNTDESKTAVMAANTDIMDEKLNKDTEELIQVFSYDDDARNHVINSIN